MILLILIPLVSVHAQGNSEEGRLQTSLGENAFPMVAGQNARNISALGKIKAFPGFYGKGNARSTSLAILAGVQDLRMFVSIILHKQEL